MSKNRKSSNEKQQLRAQIESIRGETRKLQEKYTFDSERLEQLNLHQEKVLACINEVNKQNKLLEQRINVAQNNKDLGKEEIELNHARIENLYQEKLTNAIKSRAKYTRMIREIKDKILSLHCVIEKDIQVYDQTIRSREIAISEASKKLKVLEDKEYKLFTNLLSKAKDPLDFMNNPLNGIDDFSFTQLDGAENGRNLFERLNEQAVLQRQIDTLVRVKNNLLKQVSDLQNRYEGKKLQSTLNTSDPESTSTPPLASSPTPPPASSPTPPSSNQTPPESTDPNPSDKE